jgi:hypothetical protein
MPIGHKELCGVVDELAELGQQRGQYSLSRFNFGEDLRVFAFRRPAGFSMVKLSRSSKDNVGTFIQIAGGGALGVPANADLCRSIFERHINIDWGGPFVRSYPDGSLTYGTQVVLPSILFDLGNSASFGFLLGMVELFGEVARSIAVELVPRYGGDLLDGSNSQHENDLFGALAGPPPPSL